MSSFEIIEKSKIKVIFVDEVLDLDKSVVAAFMKNLMDRVSEAEGVIGCRIRGHYCRGEGQLKQISNDGKVGMFQCDYLVKNDDGNCKT